MLDVLSLIMKRTMLQHDSMFYYRMIVIQLFLIYPLCAKPDYLSPMGNNSNPGTIERPWWTLQTAAGKRIPGVTLLIPVR